MKSGYDQFFKKARANAQGGRPVANKKSKSTPATHHKLSERDLEEHLKSRMGLKAKRKTKKGIPWKLAGVSFLGLIIAGFGYVQHDKLEKYLSLVEVSFLGSAQAQTEEREPAAVETPTATPAPATSAVSNSQELDHLSKFREKKKELDAREEEISRMESELLKQKEDLEARLAELKETREHISKMLEDRVKADEEKVETLVQVYSNMRPPQAAKIFETLDEDLAIEILGRMKKKNAADIMNLLNPEKAQIFSEKFAGYKRK